MPKAEPKNGKKASRVKKSTPEEIKTAVVVVSKQSSVAAAKVSKKKRKSSGKAERKIATKPKAKTAAKPKAKTAARKDASAAAEPKLSSSASAARAVSVNVKDRQAQRMSQYRRRLTMEKRVLEFWDMVGGSALLIDITSGGVARSGRPHIVGSGRFSSGFRKLTLHTVLKRIIDDNADWRKAAREMSMQTFFHKMAMEDFGVAEMSQKAAADEDMAGSSGEISE